MTLLALYLYITGGLCIAGMTMKITDDNKGAAIFNMIFWPIAIPFVLIGKAYEVVSKHQNSQ